MANPFELYLFKEGERREMRKDAILISAPYSFPTSQTCRYMPTFKLTLSGIFLREGGREEK